MKIFVTGNVLSQFGKAVSFGILVPISYLLLISAVVWPFSKKFAYVFHTICIGMFLCVFSLGRVGIQSSYLELLAVGLLGVVCGFAPSTKIAKLVSRPFALGLAYCLYLCLITLWDPYLVRVVGVCLTLMILYALGVAYSGSGRLATHLIVLGRYSLFGYIWQIAILQFLHWALGHGITGTGASVASFFAGFAVTMGSIEALDRLRTQSRTLDQAYRVAFA
jgi:hypothetical protein